MSSYPKSSKDSSYRASRPRKRHFYGNKFKGKKGETLFSNSSEMIQSNPLHSYRLIEFFTVFTALSNLVICRNCKEAVKFEETGNRGLGFKIVVLCSCGRGCINSGPFINSVFEVNCRIAFVMRLLGIGREGLNLFCNLMDICDGISKNSYNTFIEHIYSATKSVFEYCSKKAVDEEKMENEKQKKPILNLKVSSDSSWKKRSFKSLYGVTTLVGYYTGKVIDFIVKNSYCEECTSRKDKNNTQEYCEWYENHKEGCMKKHKVSTGKMEIDAVIEMFMRSDEKFGVKYGNYIEDRDSEKFKAILDINPYGDDFPVANSECIANVQKRMGTHFQNVQSNHTQNATESFNSTVWQFAPKQRHYGLKIIEIAAYMSASLFNEGYVSILQTMSALGIIIGTQSKTYSDNIDKHRVTRQEESSSTTKRARRQQLFEENQFYEEAEGLLYGPAITD